MTLCRQCLAVFQSDQNYIVRPAKTPYVDKHDDECFICSRRGRDYDIEKVGNGGRGPLIAART